MKDFDATSLYPSAVWDEISVDPKKESGFAFKPHTTETFVEAFNIQTFNHDGNECAILRSNYYKPPNLIFQHLPIKDKVKNIEDIVIRNGHIIDTLTSDDYQEIIKKKEKGLKFTKVLFFIKTLRYRLLEKF